MTLVRRADRLRRKRPPASTTPIQHVVVIFQENVSFDHYFATYPVAANNDRQRAGIYRVAEYAVGKRAERAAADRES